jgi:hypothetical protein
MGVSDLFWLLLLVLLVVLLLLPMLRQRMLENARRRLREQIEDERGTRVILLVHRQETMSLMGFPLVR